MQPTSGINSENWFSIFTLTLWPYGVEKFNINIIKNILLHIEFQHERGSRPWTREIYIYICVLFLPPLIVLTDKGTSPSIDTSNLIKQTHGLTPLIQVFLFLTNFTQTKPIKTYFYDIEQMILYTVLHTVVGSMVKRAFNFSLNNWWRSGPWRNRLSKYRDRY